MAQAPITIPEANSSVAIETESGESVEPRDLAELASRIARGAGALLLERFRRPASGVATKRSATDMVSDADRESEAFILEAIARDRPSDTVVGEESGEHAGSGGLTWIVDPLDGTTNFLFGQDAWSVSICVRVRDRDVAAAVYDPPADELFTAVSGSGMHVDGLPGHVRSGTDLRTALIATGFAYDRERRARQGEIATRVLLAARDIRRRGSAALDLAWVAAGRLDGYYERHLGLWDLAAGAMLVREAGGVVRPITMPPDPVGLGVVAAQPGIIDALEAVVVDV